jgi:uncharacterized protein YrrD
MTSYLTLQAGATVRASNGEKIGTVEHVLADHSANIFDGLVIDTRIGPGGHRFVDAYQVASMDAEGVTLTLSARDAESLPDPSGNPATMAAGPGDADPGLSDKLRRAWDLISGRG